MKTSNGKAKAFIALLLIAGCILACQTSSGAVAGLSGVADGVYTGTGQGNNGSVTMEVTVKGGKITAVTPAGHNESPSISDPAFERVPKAIVDRQSLAVDTVSGATNSSRGIIDAVTAALESAGANIAALKTAGAAGAKAALTQKKETYDIVVIGAGGAGLAAAISAQQAGQKVLILEKMPRAGGNTIISGAAFNAADPGRQSQAAAKLTGLQMNDGYRNEINAIINRAPKTDTEKAWQAILKQEFAAYNAKPPTVRTDDGKQAQVIFDSVTLHMLQTYNGGDYIGTPALIETLCKSALPTLEWVIDMGMEFRDNYMFTVLGGLWPRAHQPIKPLGTGYIETGLAYLDKHKDAITVLYETKATELISSGGRVTGVKAESATTAWEFTAKKAVIIATGGFGANKELRQKYNSIKNLWPNLDNSGTTNHPGATGDGLVMAEKVGAAMTGLEWIQMLPMGDPKTGSLSGNIEQGVDSRFFVNKNGDRFCDEGGRRDDMTKALIDQPDSFMWVIVDKYSYPTPDVKNNFNESIAELVAAGRAYEANTVAELAGKIGVPAANLQKAFDEFNKGVDAKTDRFGRKVWGPKLTNPPYYAGGRIPTVHHTMGGLVINEKAQVLNASGQAIPGLYAAGEVTGGIHGSNRLGGNALADIHVFGRIAGTNASKE
jgi:flavocytochrome c